MNWDDARFLIAIAEGTTLSAAARRLRVNQSTAARRLARLESGLGTRLFERTAGRLRPTAEGDRALTHARAAEESLRALDRELSGWDGRLEGTVRLTALLSFCVHWIAPRLPTLQALHPGLTLDLLPTGDNLSLGRREADLALRHGHPTAGPALTRKVASLGYAAYAVASLAERAKREGMTALPWADCDLGLDTPEALLWVRETVAPPRFVARAPDAVTLLAIARSGVAACLLPCHLGDGDPALLRLTGSNPVTQRDLWLLSHPDQRELARVVAVKEWLLDALAQDNQALRGLPPPSSG
jgi:DNA-binding transcriptional LysR family regulator